MIRLLRKEKTKSGSLDPIPKGNQSRFSSSLIRRLLSKYGDPPLRFIFPSGQAFSAPEVEPVGSILIHDVPTIWALAIDPLFQFGEAYSEGRLEIQGEMTEILTELYRTMNQCKKPSLSERLFSSLRRPVANSLQGSRRNIRHHYDIGNDFYQLWLDRQMVYTCAYFGRKDDTLEQAQVAKMDHVCRKLRLKPGMKVVEAGCGWGALAIHMAKHYGVHVTAFNISREQIAWARQNARQQNLDGKVCFVQDDWRNIQGRFDAFVSVGMLEHVGVRNYSKLGVMIHQVLKPEGTGLIHSIGQNSPQPLNSWIERRIFPGAYPPTLKQMMEIFEPDGFSVLDVENLRLHYAETLRHWLERFESSVGQVEETFGEQFVRMWRLYLAGSVAAFESGWLQLFQITFNHGISNNVPQTRAHLYDSAAVSGRIEYGERFTEEAGDTSHNNLARLNGSTRS